MKNQSKIILISALGMIASVGLYLFVVSPTLNKVANLSAEVSVKKTELKQLEEQIIIYRNSQRDLARASGKEVISKGLVEREVLQVAIVEIENAAAATQTTETLNINDTGEIASTAKPVISGKAFLDEVEYNINTTSDFAGLVSFMQYLEHLPHFTEISKFNLQSSAGNPTASGVFVHDGTILGSIDLVFFLQKSNPVKNEIAPN